MSTRITRRKLLDDAIKWLMDAKDAERDGREDEMMECVSMASIRILAAALKLPRVPPAA